MREAPTYPSRSPPPPMPLNSARRHFFQLEADAASLRPFQPSSTTLSPSLILPCNLSPYLSLSFSISLFLSLNVQPMAELTLWLSIHNMHYSGRLRRCHLVKGQLSGGQLTVVAAARAMLVAMPWLPGVVPLSPAIPTAISSFHEVLFEPTIVMVPLVLDKSGRISTHAF